MMHGKNLVDGQWSATGKSVFKTFNPGMNDANEWIFYEATPEEIGQAVMAASEAFETYKHSSGAQRSAFLEAIAEELEVLRQEIVHAYCLESGLPEGRANGELGRTINQLLLFANLVKEGSWVEASIDTALPERSPVPKPDIRKMKVPLGPVVVFGASNFPLAFSTAGGDTASALAAGCPVIVKSHPLHAGTGELVATAIKKAMEKEGIPSGVFANLNSKDHRVGETLVQHPGIKAVGFTGSFSGGSALQNLARERKEPIPVFAEMGSVNPMILLPTALKNKGEFWADQIAASINLGAGQFCTNPGILIATEGEALDNFCELLKNASVQQPAQCMLHPDIYKNFKNGFRRLLDKTSVSLAAEQESASQPNYGNLTLASVQAKDLLEDEELMEEVFGPFSILVRCKNNTERDEIIKRLKGQLTISILGEADELDTEKNLVAIAREKAGRLVINGVPTGVEVCTSMHHGGPWPATTDSRFTSVGTGAIHRWVRPVAFQNFPESILPDALKSNNPLGILRTVNGTPTKDPVHS
ncbi:aldehyde dehydrogenase (NADP(+)) [Robertkochia marina]|uniref:Aldehyde dehydrogenase (NADP(+)) n=1 Tax=Robertkochia marina TaxID=1227945 RepID=A0A4S3M441_9FLAO|nr:aldehyde dehydrogenase (NADP(+)) [Robertkochia marina]THD69071.1 aldehyde dehydrogenase (NADP(+)) [Robertkochia marina]TRZ44895.1 aldehyde dehydrogenase (NADP(+)) [Robertkochia marina]